MDISPGQKKDNILQIEERYMYVCVCVCIRMCVYVCVYACTHTLIHVIFWSHPLHVAVPRPRTELIQLSPM